VAATTQEEVLAGILPKINIDKITLTNPSEDILNVSLNLTIKEVLDDNLFGSWFEDININKYIVVDVVQSTDASVTEALSYSNDMIQVCNLQRQLKIKDTRTKALAYITKNTKVSDLLKLLADKTTRLSLSLNNTKNKVTSFTSYTNSDGEKIYEVPYKADFSIPNQPEHLAYFVVCSIDLDTLCSDLKIDYDIAESFEENGRVSSEIVIEDFKVVGESYIYADSNGEVWSGPVHQDKQGNWRSGDDETVDSIDLDRILVTNTKIQDFRRFNRIERMMVDFNSSPNFSLLSENSVNNITKIQTSQYKPKSHLAEFTEMYTANDANGNLKFLFGINFLNVLRNYSKFSHVLRTNNDTFKEEVIRNTRILELKLCRTRIKNATHKPYEKLNPEEPDEIILQTRDVSWKNFLDINTDTATIKESDLLLSNTNNFLRFFTGIDKSFKDLADGVYQYWIEIEIEDGITEFVKDKLQQLEVSKQMLVEYANKISKPTMKTFILENKNPHIDSPSEYSQNSLVADYGYDIVSNKLSPQLISKIISEYGGIQSLSAPWNTCSAIFSYILDIFSSEIATEEDRREIAGSMFEMLNPNSTNPQIVLRTIEMISYFISNISKTFDISLDDIRTLSSQTSVVGSKTNKSLKVKKIFDGSADTSIAKSFGIDYLSNTNSQPVGDDGLLVLSSGDMLTRSINEMLKFYTTQTPNISFPDTADNFDNLKYSYLTPTRIDFPNKTTMFARLSEQQTTNTRNVEHFFQNENSFEKAVSIHADVLNFKMDVGGKNRFLVESERQNGQLPTVSAPRSAVLKKQIAATNKMKEVFSQYASTTFQKYSIQSDSIVGGVQNEAAILNFMSSLSSDTLRTKQVSGYKKANIGKGFVPSVVEEDYIRKLSSLAPSKIQINNNIVTGFRRTFQPAYLKYIPNQLRAIIFKPEELQSDMAASVRVSDSYVTTTNNKAVNYFHFEMIAEIQYLERFENTTNSSDQSVINPVWKTMNKQFLNSLSVEKEILCRIISFDNPNLGIKRNTQVEERCYDKHFIIKTSRIPVTTRPTITIGDNPIIDRFIDTVRISLPGIQIRESLDIRRSLIPVVPSIEITRIDTTGLRNLIQINDIRDVVARDISTIQDSNVGQIATPAAVTAAVNIVSLAFQNANISSGVRSSNFVPNINLRTGRRV
jgi:hypothetical protein